MTTVLIAYGVARTVEPEQLSLRATAKVNASHLQLRESQSKTPSCTGAEGLVGRTETEGFAEADLFAYLDAKPPADVRALSGAKRGCGANIRRSFLLFKKSRTREVEADIREWVTALSRTGPASARRVNQFVYRARGMEMMGAAQLFEANDFADFVVERTGRFPKKSSAETDLREKEAAVCSGRDLKPPFAKAPPFFVRPIAVSTKCYSKKRESSEGKPTPDGQSV